MIRIMMVTIILILISGCLSHDTQVYGTIDKSNKTVMVPTGSEGLKGKLKQTLAKNGWKLVVYKGASVTEGKVGENTKLESYDTFKAKYRLIVNDNQYDICVNLSPAIYFDISFIDNESGSEVFTISGNDCESDAVESFMNTIQKNSI